MRIAIVTLGYHPFRRSGLDVTGERLVRGLLDYGHQVDVFSGGNSKSVENGIHPNLRIYRLPFGISDWIGYSYRITQLLKKVNKKSHYDIVHFLDVYFGYAYNYPFLASLQHSFRQRIMSIKYQFSKPRANIYRYIYYSFTRAFIELPSLKKATGLLAGSEATREEYLLNYHVPPERIALARHGIDTEFFRKIENSKEIRKKLGFSEKEPIILFVGFITPRKGLEYLIQALHQINPTPLLLIIGRWISNKYRERVLDLAGPVKNQIIELGYVPDHQMPLYYSLADIYTSSSLLEGFGIPIIEALSCQTPVVVVNSGASAEVSGPGGFLVKPGDVYDLAYKISLLLKDNELRQNKGLLGREYVRQNFSLNSMLQSTLEAYDYFK